MTKEEFDNKVKIIIACNQLNNHDIHNNKCEKCGYVSSWYPSINVDAYATAVALVLSGYKAKRFICNMRWDKNITYDEEAIIREYLAEKITTIKNKQKIEQLKGIYKLTGGIIDCDWDIRAIAPTAKAIEKYGNTLFENRKMEPKWIEEIKKADFSIAPHLNFPPNIDQIGIKNYLEILKYKIENNSLSDAKSFGYLFYINLDGLIAPDEGNEKLIPFFAPGYLYEKWEHYKKYAKEIAKVLWIPGNLGLEVDISADIIRLKHVISQEIGQDIFR